MYIQKSHFKGAVPKKQIWLIFGGCVDPYEAASQFFLGPLRTQGIVLCPPKGRKNAMLVGFFVKLPKWCTFSRKIS